MKFLLSNPARVAALVVAVIPVLHSLGVSLPEQEAVNVVLAALALFAGEAVQRVENAKTDEALRTPTAVHFGQDLSGE